MPSIEKKYLEEKQTQIFITETCNYNCDGCPYPNLSPDRQAELHRQELNPDEWKIITDYLHSQGIRLFCLIGGEPCSYQGITEVINNITKDHPDSYVLLSTSGLHLQNDPLLRKQVADALAQPHNRVQKNGLAISFDALPSVEKPKNSREHKAKEGLALLEKLQTEYGNQIAYSANIMICPENISDILTMQSFLKNRGIYTNLCTEQTKCFGKNPVFNDNDVSSLKMIAEELINRKLAGGLVTNSINYLSQLPEIIGFEKYECWHEDEGSPVIDIGPNGQVRFCNWLGQESPDGPPGIDIEQLMSGESTWPNFFSQSKETAAQSCHGCSWSRRDRNIKPMVNLNLDVYPIKQDDSSNFQNFWAKTQLS